MTDYFVRHKTQWGTGTTCSMHFDQGEAPSKSLERGKLVTQEVPINDELKKEYETYTSDFQNAGAGYNRASPNNHFPLNFFEWLKVKFPESEG